MAKKYNKHAYFRFLYVLAFGYESGWEEVLNTLRHIPYVWRDRMDENRKYDGIEIRKYYLSDKLGYMPDGVDVYDEDIFGRDISVLEVLLGFANRLCRDFLVGYTVEEVFCMFLKNLGILGENGDYIVNEEAIEYIIEQWEMGDPEYCIFYVDGLGETGDLWNQAMRWINSLE